uniref:Uncharacterized protein n=1 Tax=Tanacetum cinerariifolium TaxID=118510 RepID=A0A6L2P7R3_TANCI|nr:hypothetical protein [Tanacetum cinerariifolium]
MCGEGSIYTPREYPRRMGLDRSLRDNVICDLNKTLDLFQEPPHNCPKCGNPVDGQYCKGCALLQKKFKEDLFTYFIENGIFQDYQDTSEPSNDNTNIANALQEPFVVKQDPGAYYGYNFPSKVPVVFNPEPCNNQTIDELPQTLPSFDPICYIGNENSFTYDSQSNIVDDSPNVFNPPQQPSTYSYVFCGNDAYHGHDFPLQVLSLAWETILEIELAFKDKHCQPEDILELFRRLHNDVQKNHEELAVYINTLSWDRPTICYNDDDDEDYTIAITPILSTEEPDNSLSMGDEHLDTILTKESNEVIKSSVENLVLIPKEISIGSTTTRSDISLPDYEVFYDDHVKEISSGSTTTHSNFSLYDSFIFDLLINPFPPADRSDFYHEEFTDGLANIISPPEYDCFCFKNEPNSGDFTMDAVEDIFPTREPRVHVHNVLTTHSTLQLNLDFVLSSESLFAYVVWIFLIFLSYLVAPQYLLSFGNEDTIFDPGISTYHVSSFMSDVSHRSGTFMKFNGYPKHLNGSSMDILFSTCSSMDQ